MDQDISDYIMTYIKEDMQSTQRKKCKQNHHNKQDKAYYETRPGVHSLRRDVKYMDEHPGFVYTYGLDKFPSKSGLHNWVQYFSAMLN